MTKQKTKISIFMLIAFLLSWMPIKSAEALNTESKVIYNLGNGEVLVDFSEEEGTSEGLKTSDTAYTIFLEDNAFFPYEVQFRHNGVISEQWFNTPYDTVTIGDYEFSIYTLQNDPTQFQQLGLIIDGEYVAILPDKKEFVNSSVHTLLPITEREFSLNLGSFSDELLEKVALSYVLSDYDTDSATRVAWTKYEPYSGDSNDHYQLVNINETVDLTNIEDSYYSSMYLELLVGSGDQLDLSNVKYTITISFADEVLDEIFNSATISMENANGEITPVKYYSNVSTRYSYVDLVLPTIYSRSILTAENYQPLTVSFDLESVNLVYPDYNISLYYLEEINGIEDYYTEEELIRNNPNYKFSTEFSGWENQDIKILIESSFGTKEYLLRLDIYGHDPSVFPRNYLFFDDNDQRNDVDKGSSGSFIDGILNYTFYLKPGYSDEETYYISFYHSYVNEYGSYTSSSPLIKAAYVGHYESLSEVPSDAKDLSSTLFSSYDTVQNTVGTGYGSNFSNDGVSFTVFDEFDQVFHLVVKVVATEEDTDYEEDLNEILTSFYLSRYFSYNNADSNSTSSGYGTKISSSDDSYHTLGYQTLLIDDSNVNISEMIPSFSLSSGGIAYADVSGNGAEGIIQESGKTVVDFSNETVIYTIKGADETASDITQNYVVTMGKATEDGSKLFVNGPKIPTSEITNSTEKTIENTRTLYLTEDYDEIHDIFLANLGNENLENIKVTLTDHNNNIQLDEYWDITGTTTLGTFAKFNTSFEKENFAKIRIIPKEYDEYKMNDTSVVIDGSLVISADNDQSYTVFLTGLAGNPEIITNTISESTKYVPYSVMIQTNNTFSDIKQTFSIDGDLPTGMELLPTGEIYGVPRETGIFSFTVTAHFDYIGSGVNMSHIFDELEDSVKKYTLTVLDNTNENVESGNYDQVLGDTLTERIADFSGVPRNQTIISLRDFGEFTKLFLNGEELTEGIHYEVEEGSTKITIFDDTFGTASSGDHTIGAEFRTQDNVNAMSTTAQNYTATNVASNAGSSGSSGSSSNSSSSGSSSSSSTVIATSSIPVLNVGNGGSASINPEIVEKGNFVTITVIPDEGYMLDSIKVIDAENSEVIVYENDDGTYFFTQGMLKATIDVFFVELPIIEEEFEEDNTLIEGQTFYDVKPDQWYFPYVDVVVGHGVMAGIGEGFFAPNEETLRGMIVTMLHSYAGKPVPEFPDLFDDVSPTDYYFAPCLWAREHGLIVGIGNNSFSAESPVTREEICLILYKFSQIQDKEFKTSINLPYLSDATSINNWAAEAVYWCYYNGIISGRDDYSFDPQATATRAEVATMLTQFIILTS